MKIAIFRANTQFHCTFARKTAINEAS